MPGPSWAVGGGQPMTGTDNASGLICNEGVYSGNVRVAVRLRPLSARERLAGSNEVVQISADGTQIVAAPDRLFTFDYVFGTETPQAEIYDAIAAPLVEDFLEGFNCTVLAYGQTGSGKTYTMGTGLDGNLDPLTQGIIPRSVKLLVERLESSFGLCDADNYFEIYTSFLELYNEEIVDLLNPQSADKQGDRTRRPVLTIREDPQGAICIAGVKEERANSMTSIFDCLQKGTLCRTTKSTDMNLVSSRSHAIFTLCLRQRKSVCNPQTGEAQVKNRVSKLHFVDLAGSERLKRTNAIGDRAKESICINSGLLALGNVISALGDESRKASHVPYRDSKLTRLLQDSLGGNSRTLMIACISPSSDNYPETLNTLKYANRARNIRNRAAINEDANGNSAFEIMQLKKQVSGLKQEILQLRGLGMRSGADRKTGGLEKSDVSSVEELARLRAQNRDLQRRVETLTKEKLAMEAERDFFKSAGTGTNKASLSANQPQINAIKEHLKTISDLRGRIAELERRPDHQNSGAKTTKPSTAVPETPATPKWFYKANDVIDRTRNELRSNSQLMDDMQNPPITSGDDEAWAASDRFAAAVATRTDAILGQIQNDISLKEELLVQLESSKQEFLVMRQKYEERMKLLQENIASIQRERDEVLRTAVVATPRQAVESSRITRIKCEDKIKKMGREINELKDKLAEANREQHSRASTHNESMMKTMRNSVQTLKNEKSRLQAKLDELQTRLYQETSGQEEELTELRIRERKSSEQARKYKKAYDFQKSLLQRRIEQYMQTKQRMRNLIAALRRHRIPLSPSVGSLLSVMERNASPAPSPHSIRLSALGSHSISATDLPSSSGSASGGGDLVDKYNRIALTDDEDAFGLAPDDEMEFSQPDVLSTPKSSRNPSLVDRSSIRMAPVGTEVPRSVLRMSPLIPHRKDMFARLADAASLSLASRHLSLHLSQTPSGQVSPSARKLPEVHPSSPMKVDDPTEDILDHYYSQENHVD